MEAVKSNAKLENLPPDVLEALREFLQNGEQVKILENQLYKTAIIIDDGKYQISISSINELRDVIESLNELYEA